ncbi:MAG: uncharacterized protein QOK28_3898 [Actinomycetota bacterium]
MTSHLEDVADASLDDQVRGLEAAVATNVVAQTILTETPGLNLPSWYLGAGAITGCVWNLIHGFDPRHGIKDYDLVYFDTQDLTSETETAVEHAANQLFKGLGVHIDVTNEARVHLWYEERFGTAIEPYRSTEHAISTWPTTASSIGVRHERGVFTVCAPFGLRDLFGLVVRPNKTLVSSDVYESKALRWQAEWPRTQRARLVVGCHSPQELVVLLQRRRVGAGLLRLRDTRFGPVRLSAINIMVGRDRVVGTAVTAITAGSASTSTVSAHVALALVHDV